MPHTLDRSKVYTSAPRQRVLGSLRLFAKQCRIGFREARAIKFPPAYRSITQIVIVGMGGSALGSDVLRSVFRLQLGRPLTIVNDYELPASVDRRTLVVLSSYSGTTEEVLTAANQASRRGARITGLTQGAKLGAFFRRHHLPWYAIDGSFNPAGQPRLGLGYNAMGQLGLLASLGLVRVSQKEVEAVVRHVEQRSQACDVDAPSSSNQAKQLARSLHGRVPILVGAEHLTGSMHAFTNQLNETAKTFAVHFPLPELNHHLLEGLRLPPAVRRGIFVVPQSSLLPVRIRQRQRITAEIAARHHLAVAKLFVRGQNRLVQAFDVLTMAGFVSLYLSVLNGVDPLAIPTVNELKKKLARV